MVTKPESSSAATLVQKYKITFDTCRLHVFENTTHDVNICFGKTEKWGGCKC